MVKNTGDDQFKAVVTITDTEFIIEDFVPVDDSPEEKFNPNHVPAGSPQGGQFTSAPTAPIVPTGSFFPALGDEYWSEGGRFGDRFEDFSQGINATGKFTMENGKEIFIKEINFNEGQEDFLGTSLEDQTEYEDERDKELLTRTVAEEIGTEGVVLQVWNISRDDDVVIATEWVDGKPIFYFDPSVDGARQRKFNDMTSKEYTDLLVTEAIIGNIDRHPGNAFIAEDGRVILIDNGRAFSDIGFEGFPHARVVMDSLERSGQQQLDMETMAFFADRENVASLSDLVERTNVLADFELDAFNSRLTSMSRVGQIAVARGGMSGDDFFDFQGDEELLLTTWLTERGDE